VLLEARAGGRWRHAGQVLGPQEGSHDYPFVLAGEWMGKVVKALKLVGGLLLLAGKQVVKGCANEGSGDNQAFSFLNDGEFGYRSRCHIRAG
jgi:hypothetical protein